MLGMLHERSGDLDAALAACAKPFASTHPMSRRCSPWPACTSDAVNTIDPRAMPSGPASSRGRPPAASTRRLAASSPTSRRRSRDALAEAGERRDAIEQYRRALDRCPTFHDVRHRLGIVLREAGLPSQATAEFARILRTHPGMLESQIQLGLTYYSMGRTPETRPRVGCRSREGSQPRRGAHVPAAGRRDGLGEPEDGCRRAAIALANRTPNSVAARTAADLSFQSIPQAPSIHLRSSGRRLVDDRARGACGEDAKDPDA